MEVEARIPQPCRGKPSDEPKVSSTLAEKRSHPDFDLGAPSTLGPGGKPSSGVALCYATNVAGVWGYVGALFRAPQQGPSRLPTCGVFGQCGVVESGSSAMAEWSGIYAGLQLPHRRSSPTRCSWRVPTAWSELARSPAYRELKGAAERGDRWLNKRRRGLRRQQHWIAVHGINGEGSPAETLGRPDKGCGVLGESFDCEGVFGSSGTQYLAS